MIDNSVILKTVVKYSWRVGELGKLYVNHRANDYKYSLIYDYSTLEFK